MVGGGRSSSSSCDVGPTVGITTYWLAAATATPDATTTAAATTSVTTSSSSLTTGRASPWVERQLPHVARRVGSLAGGQAARLARPLKLPVTPLARPRRRRRRRHVWWRPQRLRVHLLHLLHLHLVTLLPRALLQLGRGARCVQLRRRLLRHQLPRPCRTRELPLPHARARHRRRRARARRRRLEHMLWPRLGSAPGHGEPKRDAAIRRHSQRGAHRRRRRPCPRPLRRPAAVHRAPALRASGCILLRGSLHG